jgi:hypothetical protein
MIFHAHFDWWSKNTIRGYGLQSQEKIATRYCTISAMQDNVLANIESG